MSIAQPLALHISWQYWANLAQFKHSVWDFESGSPPSAPRSLLKLFKHSPLPSLLLLPLPTTPHSKPNTFPFLCYIKIKCRKSSTLSSGLCSISRAYSHVAAELISGAHLFSAGTKCSQLFPVQGRWVAYQSHAFRSCGTDILRNLPQECKQIQKVFLCQGN